MTTNREVQTIILATGMIWTSQCGAMTTIREVQIILLATGMS